MPTPLVKRLGRSLSLTWANLLILMCVTLFALPTQAKAELWLTDLAAATNQAQRERKPLLIDFTGSDWCAYCRLLQEEVFNQPEFINFAKEHLVLLEVDFPRQKKLSDACVIQNGLLQNRYDITLFPSVVVLSADGKKLGVLGYEKGGLKPWLTKLQTLIQ